MSTTTQHPSAYPRVHDDGGTPLIDGDINWDEVPQTTIEDAPYQRAFGTDTFYVLDYVVAKPIDQQYVLGDELVTLRKTTQELKDASWQIENLPHTLSHPNDRSITDVQDIRGFWANPKYVEDTGQTAQLHVPVTDTEAQQFITDNPSVSIGFNPDIDWDVADDDIDGIPRDWVYDHIASVKQGRCSLDEGCGWEGALADGSIHEDAVQSVNSQEKYTIDCPECGHTFAVKDGDYEKVTDNTLVDAKFSKNDWVSWTWDGATVYGRVSSVTTDGTLSVDGGSRKGTTDDPAYKLRHWDDGDWGNMAVKSESELNKASAPEGFTDAAGDDICTAGPCSCGRHTSTMAESTDPTTPTNTMTDDDTPFSIDSIDQMNKAVVIDKHDGVAELIDEKDSRIEELDEEVDTLEDERDAAQSRADELADEVADFLKDEFTEKAQRLCDAVEKYDIDDLTDQYESAEDLETKRALVDDIDGKLELVDAVVDSDDSDENAQSTSNGVVDSSPDETVTDSSDSGLDITPDSKGRLDLRTKSD